MPVLGKEEGSFPRGMVAEGGEERRSPKLKLSMKGVDGDREDNGDASASTSGPEEVRAMRYDPGKVPRAERNLISSVVLRPRKREHWFELTDEVWHLCREAERRQRKHSPEQLPTEDGISRAFIAQRLDVDDPILGYTVRRTREGWLQGAAWATHFTHWCRHFRWDSTAPNAGIKNFTTVSSDRDGSLSAALQQQPCSGNPDHGGVAFPHVAEIGLIAALGCGGFLLQLLLEELQSSGQYDFAVVHATPDSMRFYEKFGFTRVGAVAKYSKWRAGEHEMGYRHWLGSDEELHYSDRPSIMMAQRLVPRSPSDPGECSTLLKHVLVSSSPTIQPTEVPRLPTPEEQQQVLHEQARRAQKDQQQGGSTLEEDQSSAEAAASAGDDDATLGIFDDEPDDDSLAQLEESPPKSRAERLSSRQRGGDTALRRARDAVYSESLAGMPDEASVVQSIRASSNSRRSQRMKRKQELDPELEDPLEHVAPSPKAQKQRSSRSQPQSVPELSGPQALTPSLASAAPTPTLASAMSQPRTSHSFTATPSHGLAGAAHASAHQPTAFVSPRAARPSGKTKAAEAAFAAVGKPVPWADDPYAVPADEAGSAASTVLLSDDH